VRKVRRAGALEIGREPSRCEKSPEVQGRKVVRCYEQKGEREEWKGDAFIQAHRRESPGGRKLKRAEGPDLN
jgi:hypothetical protein